jgi:hypothetical protein
MTRCRVRTRLALAAAPGRTGHHAQLEHDRKVAKILREDLQDYIGLTAEITEITDAVLISDLLPADAPDYLGADFRHGESVHRRI